MKIGTANGTPKYPPCVLCGVLAVVTASAFGAGVPLESSGSIAREVTDYASSHHYSGAILIQDRGTVVLRRAFGLANRGFQVANRVDTKFKQASITKLFTSTLIMQLSDRGRLDINKPISAYLPNYTGEGAGKVSIYQLMTATSGIEDFGKGGDEPFIRRYTSDELLAKFSSGKLTREPGTTFNYNNADFVILGKIIEAVSGRPYEAALKDLILDPLEMGSTGLLGNDVVEGLAESYLWDKASRSAKLEPPYAIGNFYAAGGMYSTLDDLKAFSDALYGGKLLKPPTLETLLTPNRSDYACGLWVSEYNFNGTKVKVAERQGSIGATTNRLLRVVDRGVTIILLTNMDTVDLDDMQVGIIARFIPGLVMPSFAATAEPPSGEAKVGSAFDFVVKVTSTAGGAVEDLVDVEIKDESGAKVEQITRKNLSFRGGETETFSLTWTPKKPGRYTISVGVFQAGWKVKHLWRDAAATILVR